MLPIVQLIWYLRYSLHWVFFSAFVFLLFVVFCHLIFLKRRKKTHLSLFLCKDFTVTQQKRSVLSRMFVRVALNLYLTRQDIWKDFFFSVTAWFMEKERKKEGEKEGGNHRQNKKERLFNRTEVKHLKGLH